jgi:ATP-binding cassette, subfamily C, bacterial LapB
MNIKNTNKINKLTDSRNYDSAYFRCLVPLLDALGWHGKPSALSEALPYCGSNEFDFNSLLSTLSNLHFKPTVKNCPFGIIEPKLLPCIYYDNNDFIYVVLKCSDKSFLVYDGIDSKFKQILLDRMQGKIVYFKKSVFGEKSINDKQGGWVKSIFSRFHKLGAIAILISLVLTILALLQPLFIMMLFGQMSSNDSIEPLVALSYGVALYLSANIILSIYRYNILNYISTRIGLILDSQILRRILYIPLAFTEKASLGSQISRIKDFQTVQKFINSRSAISLLELPFLAILIAALFAIGGVLGFIPIAGIIIFFIFGIVINPFVKNINSSSSAVSSTKQDLTVEILTNLEAIKDTNSEQIWLDKYTDFTAKAITSSWASDKINSFINNFSSLIVSISGLATITVGAVRVINGEMGTGALMASMLLTWRILGPLRSGFSVITQFNKITKSVKQADRLMNMNIENNPLSSIALERPIAGKITFNQVSLRYTADSQPALVGVSFNVMPSEMLLIRGSSGSGKSTLLKLMLGLYSAQAGIVLLDDMNIKQTAPLLLRKGIGFVPQQGDFFNGTLGENLHLISPKSSIDDFKKAAVQVNVMDEISRLKEGFNTEINKKTIDNFSISFIKKISLMGALLKDSNLLLIDEIDQFLDRSDFEQFHSTLKELKKNKTIIIISNNKNLIKLSDKVLEMNAGRIEFFDISKKYK